MPNSRPLQSERNSCQVYRQRHRYQGGLARPNNVDEENLVEKGPGAPLDETTSFIAEKKAALEVVKRRLGTRGASHTS
ncbi:MAG: hypothetical protein DMG76_08920 [Acidobacteria bacterium]|nr:MAG: hypothetical protein DMG76_08920 [Acidobacteriota bacterium]